MTNEELALELAHKINRRVCGIGTDTNLILSYADAIRRECADRGDQWLLSPETQSITLRAAIMGKE